MFSKMMSIGSLSSLRLIWNNVSMSSRFVLDVDLRSIVQVGSFALISCRLLASCINTSIVMCTLYAYTRWMTGGVYTRTIIYCFNGQPRIEKNQRSEQQKFVIIYNQAIIFFSKIYTDYMSSFSKPIKNQGLMWSRFYDFTLTRRPWADKVFLYNLRFLFT